MNPRFLILLVVLLSGALLLYKRYGQSGPDGSTPLSAVEAKAELAANPDIRILDIRTSKEYAEGHLRGALNINFMASNFARRLSELDPEATYLVYCRTGNRSARAMRVFGRQGFTHILHMSKGILDWQQQGLPLVR